LPGHTPGEARKGAVHRDIAVVVGITLAAAIVCVKFNVSEALTNWTRPLERLQLDELPGVLLVLAVSLIWFSSRRFFEANRQLELRQAAETRLAEALAENQRLGQQYVDLQESERKALARDLHDELGQYLNAIKLDAVSLGESAGPMLSNIDRVYGVVTGLIRQLRPVGFDELGVAAALEHCVGEWRARLPATNIELSMSGDVDSLDETRGMVLYRLVQEALTNIARHARAANVDIRIARRAAAASSPNIEILIADDGCGADMRAPRSGLGLVGMRERVAALGGSISLASGRGSGFKIMASLPAGSLPIDGGQS
jgi:glucose-6-phosphate-specific signal transduction histidine kinase